MPRTVPFLADGSTFGQLTVREFAGRNRHGHQLYRCACECGKTTIADRGSLRQGKRISCGCRRPVTIRDVTFRHGKSHTPEYWAFYTARSRCTDPLNKAYGNYGGRGIEFHFESFEEWYAELGPKPSPAYSVDRKNNDGHYEPGNIRWATRSEQNLNQRPRATAAAA